MKDGVMHERDRGGVMGGEGGSWMGGKTCGK